MALSWKKNEDRNLSRKIWTNYDSQERKKVTKVSPKQSYLRTVIYECDFVRHKIAKLHAVIEFVDLMPKINVTYLKKTVHSKEWLCCSVQEKTCFDFIEFIGDIGSVTHQQHISKSYTLFFSVYKSTPNASQKLRTQNNHHLSERTTILSVFSLCTFRTVTAMLCVDDEKYR